MIAKLLNIKSQTIIFILSLFSPLDEEEERHYNPSEQKIWGKKFFRRWAEFISKIHPIYKWRSQSISYSISQIPKKSVHVPRFLACQISSPENFGMSQQLDINRRYCMISFIMTIRTCSFINLQVILQPRCVQNMFQGDTIMSQILAWINLQKSSEYEKAPNFSLTKYRGYTGYSECWNLDFDDNKLMSIYTHIYPHICDAGLMELKLKWYYWVLAA